MSAAERSTSSFDIGISYPKSRIRTARKIAEVLAEELGREHIFLDEWHSALVRGNDAGGKLQGIFQNCRLVIPLFCTEFSRSMWCKLEWETMLKLLLDRNRAGAVLPVHLDGTEISGWDQSNDVGIRKGTRGLTTAAKIAVEILRYWTAKKGHLSAGAPQSETSSSDRSGSSTSANNPFKSGHGALLVADICDSSPLRERKLRSVIQALWQLPTYIRELKDSKQSSRVWCSPILDGLVLAIPNDIADGVRESGISHYRKILEAACEWIHHVKHATQQDLRIAVHEGKFFCLQDPEQIVGKAANECSRMVRLAGRQQVLVSETFISSWREEIDDESALTNLLEPNEKERPWVFEQKIGSPIALRLFRCGRNGAKGDVPPLHMQVHLAQMAVREILRQVEAEFVDNLKCLDEACDRVRLSTRVSVFAPDISQSMLLPTEFRFVHNDVKLAHQDDQAEMKGSTQYNTSGSGQGTVGRAFSANGRQVLAHLPKYDGPNGQYVKALARKPWELPPGVVRKFGRKARTFLAFPFSLTDSATPPDGVICIDSLDPLSNISIEDLELIVEDLQGRYMTSLAALWRLARSA